MTHDYKRNGTTTLFAALDIADRQSDRSVHAAPPPQEFLKFLRHDRREVPKKLEVHLIMDNYGTHKHPNVEAWLEQAPALPPALHADLGSWLNQVERCLRRAHRKAIRRGEFHSVPDLIDAIEVPQRPTTTTQALRLDHLDRLHPREGRTV